MASKVRPRSSATKAREECDDFNTSTLAYKGSRTPVDGPTSQFLSFTPRSLYGDLNLYLGEKQ
jgi:hypothetical protein